MKNLHFLLAAWLGLAAVNSKAQYFSAAYGNSDLQYAYGSTVTRMNANGNAIAGATGPSASWGAGYNDVYIVRTDVNGSTTSGAPTFQGTYAIWDLTTGIPFSAEGKAIVEMPNGNGFAVTGTLVGSFSGTLIQDLFFMTVDNSGNPLSFKRYTYAGLPVAPYAINPSATLNSITGLQEFYITGKLTTASGSNDVFVLKVDEAAAFQWDYVADITSGAGSCTEIGFDIIESPFINTQVFVVGTSIDPTGFTSGYLLELTSGGAFSNLWIYNNTTIPVIATVAFRSINPANQNSGFIIGGQYHDFTSGNGLDYLAMLVDNAGKIAWSTTYDYSQNPGTNNEGVEVKERLNTTSQYEYYMVGNAFTFFGGTNIMVVKMDNNGKSVTNGEFTYGQVNEDHAVGIETEQKDLYIMGRIRGSGIFGVGDWDFHEIGAYFNGFTTCNYLLKDALQTSCNITQTPAGHFPSSGFNVFDILVSRSAWSEGFICSSSSVAGGDNSFKAPYPVKKKPMDNGTDMALYPNPAKGIIHIRSIVPVDDVEIFDAVGRLVDHLAQPGKSIDVSTLKNGIYFIHVRAGATQEWFNIRIDH